MARLNSGAQDLLLRLLRIVVGVNVSYVEWPHPVDLNHRLSLRECVMVVPSRKSMESSGDERVRLAHLDLVSRAKIKCPGDHGKTLVLRMRVRRKLEAWGQHESDDEWPRFARIALQDGELRALGYRRRSVAPFDVFRIDEYLFVARSLS